MPVSKEFEEFVVEQFSVAGFVHSKRMFGGVGLYVDDAFCAIIDGKGRIYLKVDDSNRSDFEAEGMKAFQPKPGGTTLQYYELPVRVLEDPNELKAWVLNARAVFVAKNGEPGHD